MIINWRYKMNKRKSGAPIVKPGMIFGNWKVISFDHCKETQRPNIRGTIVTYKDNYWLCECQCEFHTRKVVKEKGFVYGGSKRCNKCANKFRRVALDKSREERIEHTEDFAGRRIGYIEVIKRHEYTDEEKASSSITPVSWDCICHRCGKGKDGNYFVVTSSHLREHLELRPKEASCGCKKKDILKNGEFNHITHGLSHTRLYRIYCGMKTRCFNENCEAYPYYGGRGITICDEWLYNFENFYNWAMENGYRDSLSIDRINNDGNYCPENCRWATDSEQANNKSTSHFIYYGGDRYTLAQSIAINEFSAATLKYKDTFGSDANWTENDKLFIPDLKNNATRDSYRIKMGICNPFVPADLIMSDSELETKLTQEQVKNILDRAPLAKDIF